jgi:hypothetical protein
MYERKANKVKKSNLSSTPRSLDNRHETYLHPAFQIFSSQIGLSSSRNQPLRSIQTWSRHETYLHPALHIFSSQGLTIIYAIRAYAAFRLEVDMRLTCTQLCIYSPHRWAFHHLRNQRLRSIQAWSRHETRRWRNLQFYIIFSVLNIINLG